MNNIAAAVSAYAGLALGLFAALGSAFGGGDARVLISCFVSAALVAHLFGGAITSTYVGIPAEDVVSVLPAHRLAKAGLGPKAVQSSADGSFVGVLIGVAAILPVCVLMGNPIGLYSILRTVMLPIVLFLSALLVLSEGFPSLSLRHRTPHPFVKISMALTVFLSAGALGYLVLDTNYYAASVPDFPWIQRAFVSRSSLLLPMFAGLFGVPGLLLSLGSRSVLDLESDACVGQRGKVGFRDFCLSLLGGTIVGWLPGMTSGSAVTLCAPNVGELRTGNDIGGSLRFIWLYSSISACGAVMSVGALFVILRARSGSMDAIAYFMGNELTSDSLVSNMSPIAAILLSILVSAIASRWLLSSLRDLLGKARSFLCSRQLSIGSLFFVAALSLGLTGSRGALLMATATSLGLVVPLIGVRRIQLMGCLLVPIAILLVRQL